jgi:glucoamylase
MPQLDSELIERMRTALLLNGRTKQTKAPRASFFGLGVLGFLTLFAYSKASLAGNSRLDGKIQAMLEQSLPRLACNLSNGSPGAIVASPQTADPNYYFHWIRDSALVVQALSRLLPYLEDTANEGRIRALIADYAAFSGKLQDTPTPHGFGEVRFNTDGSVDESSWPRPQFDGPALRALAILDDLERDRPNLDPDTAKAMESIVQKDLDAIVEHFNEEGFDLWEYAKGFHFYTRMVQEGALLQGQKYFKKRANPHWNLAASELRSQLQHHWHPEFGTIGDDLSAGPSGDSEGNEIPSDASAFSSSVVLAVNHANLTEREYDDLDSRVWSSLWQQQKYFLENFAFNANRRLGPAIGRGPGDDYYGGNAFFFITAAFAEHDFRVASRLAREQGSLIADKERLPVLRHVLGFPAKAGARFNLPNKVLARSFAREGDAFLETILDVIPADGAMAEQFSKQDGSPVSAADLSWSHASVLTAILQREEWSRSSVDFSKIEFTCRGPADISSAR